MNLLFKKMFRDIKNSWTQFVAIFLMAILGVLIYSGLTAIGNGMKAEGDKFYEDTNSADMWIYTKGAEQKDIDEIAGIEGIKDVQRRMVLKGDIETDNDAEIELIALDKVNISKPLLIEGEEFDINSDGLWISEKFATAKNYKVGDKIKVNILEKDIKFEIKGLVLSSEHVQHLGNQNEIKPKHDKYTFGFISSKFIEDEFKGFPYNQLILTLDDNSQIDDIKDKVEDLLGVRFIKSLDRDEHISFSGFSDKIAQFESLATIFPSVFFLLSLLTMFTTMTRLIEKQRLEIGILSGLGYSKSTITIHYLSYGLWIGLIGGLIGVVVGPLFIPNIIYKMLETFYILPNWKAVTLPQNYIVVGVIALCCIFSTYISCSKELNYMPATILRGRQPKSGKRILLEKIKTVWGVLSFENKWFIRDLGRNKTRSFMGIVGVFGCMMLIIAGMGMKDSVTESIDKIYRDQYLYEEKIVGENLDDGLKNMFDGKKEFVEEKYIEILNKDNKESGVLSVLESEELVKLKSIKGEDLQLKKGDIAITNMIAKELRVKVGDEIEWTISGDNKRETSEITHILDSPSPQGIYLTKESFEDMGYEFNATSLLVVSYGEISDSKILDYDNVENIILKDTQEDDSKNMLDSMVTIVYMLILAGVVLGGVILYNLGVLNYTERIREFATLKVLGFYPKEIRTLVIRENIVLTIVGWIIGIPVGLLFLKVYMGIVSAQNMEFIPYISTKTLVISSIITIICSVGVNYALSLKIDKINMVESLKSVE